MANVFTVYNCGTGFSRNNTEEVIANLATRTGGQENHDWMITDGVGQGFRTPGTVNMATGAPSAPRGLRTIVKTAQVIRGSVTGFGTKANEDHAMSVIRGLVTGPGGGALQTINMAGWSRGAITCHMLANALHNDPLTRHLSVNIFGFDPVPGPGNFTPDKITLAPNIKHYAVIQMQDERRSIMKPMSFAGIGADDHLSKYKYYVLPGAHGNAAMMTRTSVGKIGAALVHKFLHKLGTPLNNPILFTSKQYCEAYGMISMSRDLHRSTQGALSAMRLYAGEGKGLNVGQHRRGLTPNSNFLQGNMQGYFVNDHHVSQFQKTHMPLFMRMRSGVLIDGDAAAKLKAFSLITYTSLVKANLAAEV